MSNYQYFSKLLCLIVSFQRNGKEEKKLLNFPTVDYLQKAQTVLFFLKQRRRLKLNISKIIDNNNNNNNIVQLL